MKWHPKKKIIIKFQLGIKESLTPYLSDCELHDAFDQKNSLSQACHTYTTKILTIQNQWIVSHIEEIPCTYTQQKC